MNAFQMWEALRETPYRCKPVRDRRREKSQDYRRKAWPRQLKNKER